MTQLTKKKNYGPIGRFESMFDIYSKEVEDLFHSLGLSNLGSIEGCSYIAPAEVLESKNNYIINIELPGVKKEDVSISINDKRTLVISGKKEESKIEEDGSVYFSEFSSGNFHREFKLPEIASVPDIEAISEDGILSVTIPKKEKEEPKIVKINVK